MITGARQKQVACISDNLIIFQALCDNAEYPIQLFNSNYKNLINDISKLDLLIIDKNINNDDIPCYRVDNVINLTATSFSKSEITFYKPFKLESLLQIITNNLQQEYLFCCINHDWLYHERLAKISSIDTEILLTTKENDLFIELLVSKTFSANKEDLKNKIWHYHQDTESTTFETHLYKLKQKLPQDLLEINTTQCRLHIKSLV